MAQREFYPNGYGVSVIENEWSYGLELLIIKGDKDNWEHCYDTPITNDVIGHLDPDSLKEVCDAVKALPKPKKGE